MDITNPQRAKVLVHALPYIQEYSGKIVVIKYGGNAMISEKLKDSVMRDIVLLSLIGVQVVLVHGGGPEITDMLQKLGKQTQFVDGLRVTDAETADVVQMVLAGKINKTLVNLIGQKGGRAIGLSGIDGQMIQARVRDERLGYVGEITKIDVRPILDVLDKGYIPVVSTVGCDTQGHVYNINADTAAARIAGELGAESLIAMTDIGGILRDKDDPGTLIPVIHTAEAHALITSGVICGGMLPKVTCCMDAIRWGVHRVFIIDGRVPHAILIEMLTNEGIGTMFVAGQGGNANEYTATGPYLHRQHLRPLPGHDRARQGLTCLGRERQGIHRPRDRHRRQQLRRVRPRVGARRDRAAVHRAAHLKPLLHRARRAAGAAAVRKDRHEKGLLLQLRRGGQRMRHQGRAQIRG